MDDRFTSELSSIKENNEPLGWFLILITFAVTALCVAYFFLYRATDGVSATKPAGTQARALAE